MDINQGIIRVFRCDMDTKSRFSMQNIPNMQIMNI